MNLAHYEFPSLPSPLEGEIYKSIVELMPVPIIVFDKDLRFVTASSRFFEESPLKKDAIYPGDHWYSIVPDIPAKWKEGHQRCLQGEKLRCEEDRFERADGTIEWWKWEIIPWQTSSGSIEGIILYAENITRQKQFEEDLKKSVRLLSRSNNDLSKFVHRCVHDLKAPLRAVANYIHIINEDHGKELDGNIKEYFGMVSENAQYMDDLITGILENTLNRALRCNFTSMNEIVERVTLTLSEDIQSKKASITYSSLPVIYGEKTSLTQVMQNLISNALKYNSEVGASVDISANEHQDFWVFQVKDNGIGIEPKNLKRVFSEYTRLNNSVETEGLGIGLYECKRIIKIHGGKMWAQNNKDKGTTIFFTLPKISCA